jgi:hypothetical protein
VIHAQDAGAVAVILYSDPANYAPFGTGMNDTYNRTWFLPASGVQRGTAFTAYGDPLTPVYPSTGATIYSTANRTESTAIDYGR